MKKYLALICIALLSLAVACDPPEGDDEEATEESEESEEGEEVEESEDGEEASGPVELGELGVRVELPADAEVGDLIGSDDGVMIQTSGYAASVDFVGQFTKTDLEEAKEEADDLKSAEGLEVVELEDGWLMTFTNEGGAGTNYWVESVRTIGDTEITCGTMSAHEDHQAGVAEICKNLQE